MKIVYVTDALAIWGGIERVLVDKVNELTERFGYDIYVITVNQGNHPVLFPLHYLVTHLDLNIQFHQQYQFRGFRRYLKKMELNCLLERRLHEQFLQLQPDIIVCTRVVLLRTIIKVKGGTPLVFESHGMCFAQHYYHSNWYEILKTKYYNIAVRRVQQVVALTEGDAQDWQKINPHVSVIPNIVHLNPIGRYCDYNSKSVIFVGRFDAQKDISSLLKIWQVVHLRHSDWQLHIYGSYGDEQNVLMPQIRQVDANIVIHEPTVDIFNHYLDSSILVMTSLYEPFGLVLAEAMGCGLPIVAFDCPYGPADIITDGQDGFLIKDRDIHAFAEKVCLLIENSELRKTMGQVGVQSSKRYDASLIMPLWRKLFESLL